MSLREDPQIQASNRDFSLRWHAITFGIVSASLILIFVFAKKLIFG